MSRVEENVVLTLAGRSVTVVLKPTGMRGRRRIAKVLRSFAEVLETKPIPVRVYKRADYVKRGARRR